MLTHIAGVTGAVCGVPGQSAQVRGDLPGVQQGQDLRGAAQGTAALCAPAPSQRPHSPHEKSG